MPDDTEKIEILLRGRDRDLARAIDRSNKLLARFERQATKATTTSARNIERNLARAGASVRAFAGGIVGGVLAGAVTELTVGAGRTIEAIAEIGDRAKRSGLGVTEFQELAFVADQARIPIESLTDGMKELALRADEFVVTGKGPAAEAFQRLGFSATSLGAALEDPREALLDIIGRMEDLDRGAQIRIADEVFGGTGGERFVELLSQGEDGLRALISRGHDVGAVFDSEMIDKAAELDRKFGELQARVSKFFKTITVEGASAVDAFFSAFDGRGNSVDPALQHQRAADDLAEAYRDLSGDIGNLAGDLQAMSFQIGSPDVYDIADQFSALAAAMRDGRAPAEEIGAELGRAIPEAEAALGAIENIDDATLDGIVGRLSDLRNRLADVAVQAAAAATATQSVDDGSVDFSRTGPQNGRPGNRPASDLAPTSSPRPRLPSVDANFGGENPVSGGASLDGYAAEVAAIRERTQALEQEAAQLLAVASSGRSMGAAADFAYRKADLLVAAMNDGRAITPELIAEIDRLAEAYTTAGLEADAAAAALDDVERAGVRGADALSDIFLAATRGADDAKEAVLRLLFEIGRIQTLRGITGLGQASGPLGAIFGALGSALSLPSFDGGGYTGSGVRAGGIDGLGGFPAILHPGETVVDHRAASAGAATQSFHHTAEVMDDGGLLFLIRDQAGRVVAEARRSIVGDSVAAVDSAMRETRNFGGGI